MAVGGRWYLHVILLLKVLALISSQYNLCIPLSILGGIGTVLEWWPIKAYRPCPNFIERGGKYVRSGQGLDEIAFGRDSTFQASDN